MKNILLIITTIITEIIKGINYNGSTTSEPKLGISLGMGIKLQILKALMWIKIAKPRDGSG